MLSVSRPTKTARTSIPRIVLAAMLMIVLLAGIVPFSSFSSSHDCGMACCVGKPSHTAGSCSVQLGDEEHAEPPAEPGDEHSAHDSHAAHSSGATSQVVASSENHRTAKRPPAHHSKSGAKESPRTASIASEAMTTPCAPECAAAALSSSQVRRPRDPAALTIAAGPRPPTLLFFAGHLSQPLPKSAERRRLSHPRVPPSLLNNLSA
ncbi:MAG: hypothetical protein H0U54_04820 [Acidobacteria bacterium]|nr:hypothetical protein [Acidobacteriota bacterium]